MIPIFAYKKLYASLREHKHIEARLQALLTDTLDPKFIKKGSNPLRWNPVRYAQKNFFSILFLAIYRAIGIPEERREWYGAINHCLRGIVTGADNLLDDEYKEMLPLQFPDDATRFKSIMHILVFDRFLFKLAAGMKATGFCPDTAALQDALFRAIVPIGAEEAQEEGGIKTILTPSEILSSVHMYKGGKLLCLSFVAPLQLESSFSRELQQAEQGIYNVGLALQIIDDLTDFYEDILAKNHNYLVSSLFHNGTDCEKELLQQALRNKNATGPAIEQLFPETVTLVMDAAIGEALRGFALLEEAGFWFNQDQAFSLIRHLFELRGLKQLLHFFPKNPALTAATLHHAC